MLFKKSSFFSSAWWPFCSAEQIHLRNFGRGHEEHFCELIINLEQWFRRCPLCSSGGHFVQQSRTMCAILEEGIMMNISVKLF